MITATVLACVRDLRNYAHGSQLLRRVGLNLAERTSGKFKGQTNISKRGDSMLRKYLYLGMLNIVNHNPDFRRWHEQNQQKGIKKMASLFKIIGKLARMIICMIRTRETYRSQLVPAT